MRIDKDNSHLYCLCSGVFTRHYAYDSKVLCLWLFHYHRHKSQWSGNKRIFGSAWSECCWLRRRQKGKKDSSKAIQKALDYAIDNGSNSVQIKVVVPKGKYRIDKLLEIYSNTWLYLEDGATIVRNFDKGCMIKNAQANGAGGYGSERNIVIEGGCWDGNPSSTSRPFSNMRFGHMKTFG